MGKLDTETKVFMKNPARFADAFNHLIYNGEPVIKPEDLTELDTTEVVTLYGDGSKSKAPTQRWRDVLKRCTVMRDDKAIYMVLGIENQANIHYAMPVRNALYDAMNYAQQVTLARNANKGNDEKQTKAEFLSGFRREDRLLPVITLVIYFGADQWDGPLSIHEMLSTDAPEILRFVPDYKLNLIAPFDLTEKELHRFRSELGPVLEFIKLSNDDDKLRQAVNADKRFNELSMEAFNVLEDATEIGLKPIATEGVIHMDNALARMREEAAREAVREAEIKAKEAVRKAKEEERENVAADMLKEQFPLETIKKISKLSEQKIRSIAKSLGVAVL